MAVLAIQAETGLGMVGIEAQSEIGKVAVVAVHPGHGELILLLPDMAGLAVGYCMHPAQGEAPGRMDIQNCLLILPASRGMAALAIVAELPAVHIAVAIGASGCHPGEGEAGMTTGTIDKFVLPNQRKARLLMPERQRRAHLMPGLGGVAVLAIPLDIAVGILPATLRPEAGADQ